RAWLAYASAGALAAGVAAWAGGLASGSLRSSVVAVWCFVAAAVGFGLVLPLPAPLVSPLYMGVAGWLVDMLPLVVLAGWAAVVARWGVGVVRERRLPRGGRWIWLPLGLVAWTALGAIAISAADLKHFLLLWGIQALSSGTMLAVVDACARPEARTKLVAGLAGFGIVMSAGAFLQWVGVPIQPLQEEDVSARLEAAYGLDAFPNNVGLVNYVRAVESGAGRLRARLERARRANPEIPEFAVFKPRFKTFKTELVVRFSGSARAVEEELARYDITLLYDNVGLAPGDTVPRMRSFPRNSLTYAGFSAGLFPLVFALLWSGSTRLRRLGLAALVGALFGIGFSLARGAWAAVLLGIVALLLSSALTRARKRGVVAAFIAGGIVLAAVFVVRYGEDPLTARAGAEGSIGTRRVLYEETARSVSGINFVVGFGTETPRGTGGVGRYVPRAGTHSTYLNYLFRTGVPGALAIAALYAIAFMHARAASRTGPREERALAALVAASVLVLGAHAIILSLYVEPIYTLSVSLVIGIAMAGATALPGGVMPRRARAGA
ncbi:MAG TPA: O-antigen ligase family protein, partial [Actinomycetota bacterium]|nr:O-antigen ligase family protein [Actinomycetota bacterium]